MHAVSTNQVADILHVKDNVTYWTAVGHVNFTSIFFFILLTQLNCGKVRHELRVASYEFR